MEPVQFAGQTKVLGAPEGSPPGECAGLAVRMAFIDTSAGVCLQSFWKPSLEELAALNAGAHVRLTVHGLGHPPVWLDVERVQELP